MANRMFARDNIPGIQTGWKLKLFLFPGMVIQWFVYMFPTGRYSRVRQSTREAPQCLFSCPIQKLRFMFGKLSQLAPASLLIIGMILLY
jgi:hypothetical protein